MKSNTLTFSIDLPPHESTYLSLKDMNLPKNYLCVFQPLNLKNKLLIINSITDNVYNYELNIENLSDDYIKDDIIIEYYFVKIHNLDLVSVDQLDDTIRGANGYGSTGLQ